MTLSVSPRDHMHAVCTKKKPSLHFLAQCSDVSRHLDHPFAAVMVLVELAAEDTKHGHEGVVVSEVVCGCGGGDIVEGVVVPIGTSAAVTVGLFFFLLLPKLAVAMIRRHRVERRGNS